VNYKDVMRTPRTADPRVCSIDAALKVIGEKWALLALREIVLGQHRFDDIAFNTGAPRDILAARLKSLEAAGIVRRKLYQERPARYEYHLDEPGEQLFGILHAIRDWGDRFMRDDQENIVTFRHSCGAELRVEMCCAACGEVAAPGDVMADREVRRSDIVCTDG
jgi:DNA-binding HxlR family transcriptional regulator